MSGKSLSYEYVRVAEHATCPEGRRHEYAGQRGWVLGLTGCRRRWRVQMADHTIIALPRTMLALDKTTGRGAAPADSDQAMDAACPSPPARASTRPARRATTATPGACSPCAPGPMTTSSTRAARAAGACTAMDGWRWWYERASYSFQRAHGAGAAGAWRPYHRPHRSRTARQEPGMKRTSIEQRLHRRNTRRSTRPHLQTLVRETLEWAVIADQCDEYGDCWLWTGAVNAQGYPILKWPGCTCATVRRVVLALDGRPAGPRQPVATTCGERACANPAHLVRSSIRQVAQRAARAGAFSTPLRAARVAAAKRASHKAKLTAEQARAIRHSTDTGPVLAQRYGVDKSMINNIKRGEAWRDYGSPFAGLGARSCAT